MDDDPKKLGRSIHGIPVWGGLGAMKVVTAKLCVQEVLIAVPSSTRGADAGHCGGVQGV